ncbi:3-keto-5-aminohexanoate cleavage protein [Mycobacterium sp. DBP42]|uniref:3-keto-5-aminohexanoate cleavage protein n=1 Tax=Mycobacterium sp. DBP42 TaxID=2545267 RepID=UPI0014862AAA|nr:3-keto-5-aminohexanoate cleavage protein [Mycobacterium sp. DBP42]
MFDLSKDWAELPSMRQALHARGTNDMDGLPDLSVQPRWDIPELVVVGAAVSGRIVRNDAGSHEQFGLDIDSFAQAAADSIDAGACGIHFDVLGIPGIRDSGLSLPEAYAKIYAGIEARTSRDWICDANVLTGDNFAENMYAITAGLAEWVPMAPNFPVEWMETTAHVATEHGVRLTFSIHSAAEVDLANRLILSKGILKEKPMWGILIGYPYDETTSRLATYLAHPKAMMQELIQIVDRIREIDPDAHIIVPAAGRASHYLVTTAMLLGLHVRVGTEDTAFKYPHSNALLESSKESVERVRATAESLGRRLATAEEARALLGLPAGKRKAVLS